jgi:hypothetical protein
MTRVGIERAKNHWRFPGGNNSVLYSAKRPYRSGANSAVSSMGTTGPLSVGKAAGV